MGVSLPNGTLNAVIAPEHTSLWPESWIFRRPFLPAIIVKCCSRYIGRQDLKFSLPLSVSLPVCLSVSEHQYSWPFCWKGLIDYLIISVKQGVFPCQCYLHRLSISLELIEVGCCVPIIVNVFMDATARLMGREVLSDFMLLLWHLTHVSVEDGIWNSHGVMHVFVLLVHFKRSVPCCVEYLFSCLVKSSLGILNIVHCPSYLISSTNVE